MKNFLIGLFSGLLVAVMAVVIIVFSFIRLATSFRPQQPAAADQSTLVFRLEGDIPERAPTEIPLPLFQQKAPMTVQQTWETFHRAAADPHIKAIVLEPRGLSIGWARLQELRQEITTFRKSGKPIVSFLMGPGTREYYLASATDRIYLMPDDLVDVKGMRVEAMFFKNSLDKLGVKMDVIHAGKYKDAGDMFTHTAMSPETHEVLSGVLDQFYSDLVQVIAEGRKKSPEDVRALIDQGPFTGKEALADGLVDVLGYEDQLSQDLAKRLNQGKLKKIAVRSYVGSQNGVGTGTKVALIAADGEITRGDENVTFGDQSGIRSGPFIKLLRQAGDDASIKAVILRVNSPGGDAVASDEILQRVKDLSHRKPVVISMGDYAASGGYFISITGDPIIAYPNTLTGSIGVIMMKPELQGLYDKLGVTEDVLSRGHYATLDSLSEPMTPDKQAKFQQEINSFYSGFVSRVASARKKSYSDIDSIAQGRVWLGVQGKQNGLVDQLGGLDTAVDLIKQRAHISEKENVTLVSYPPRRSVLDVLMNRNDDAAVNDNPLLALRPIRAILRGLPIESAIHGGILKLMPYRIEAR